MIAKTFVFCDGVLDFGNIFYNLELCLGHCMYSHRWVRGYVEMFVLLLVHSFRHKLGVYLVRFIRNCVTVAYIY